MSQEGKKRASSIVGFAVTAVAGLVAGVGAVMTWATVIVGTGGIQVQTRGTDVIEGKVALVAGATVLIGALLLRVGKTDKGRPWAALIAMAGSIVAAAMGIIGITSTTRYGDRGAVVAARAAASGGVVSVTRGLGVWVTLAGGIAGLIGGAIAYKWAHGSVADTTAPVEETDAEAAAPSAEPS